MNPLMKLVPKTLAAMALCAASLSAARAETVVLKNGQFFEGKVKVETSRNIHLDTRFGVRIFDKKDISETLPTGTWLDAASVENFDALKPAEREILNAQAEYDLGEYDKALARVQRVEDVADNAAVGSARDWLIIEIDERKGQWETAKRLLEDKLERGAPQEKIRAQAHLDIFRSNPDYDLRFIGEKQSRNFIRDQATRDRARERNSLSDAHIMRLALEEYCEQLLAEDDMSVKAFADKLDPRVTLEAIKKDAGKGDLAAELPYLPGLINAEGSLGKAQAILGDYGRAFEFDLVRAELGHLLIVAQALFGEAVQASPEGSASGSDRRQWKEQCDEFLKRAKPVTLIYEYMLDRVQHFPDALRDLNEAIVDQSQRFEEMVKGVKRARSRSDA